MNGGSSNIPSRYDSAVNEGDGNEALGAYSAVNGSWNNDGSCRKRTCYVWVNNNMHGGLTTCSTLSPLLNI